MRVTEATNTWTYTLATLRQANASAANQLDFVIGWSEDLVEADVVATASNTSGPTEFVLYEAYASAADAAAHKETAHYLAWRTTVADCMAQPRRGVTYHGLLPEVS